MSIVQRRLTFPLANLIGIGFLVVLLLTHNLPFVHAQSTPAVEIISINAEKLPEVKMRLRVTGLAHNADLSPTLYEDNQPQTLTNQQLLQGSKHYMALVTDINREYLQNAGDNLLRVSSMIVALADETLMSDDDRFALFVPGSADANQPTPFDFCPVPEGLTGWIERNRLIDLANELTNCAAAIAAGVSVDPPTDAQLVYTMISAFPQEPGGSQTIIFVGDGVDGTGNITADSIRNQLTGNPQIRIHTVLINPETSDQDPANLRAIAQAGGGQFFLPENFVRANRVYDENWRKTMWTQVMAQTPTIAEYEVTYVSAQPHPQTIRVELTPPGGTPIVAIEQLPQPDAQPPQVTLTQPTQPITPGQTTLAVTFAVTWADQVARPLNEVKCGLESPLNSRLGQWDQAEHCNFSLEYLPPGPYTLYVQVVDEQKLASNRAEVAGLSVPEPPPLPPIDLPWWVPVAIGILALVALLSLGAVAWMAYLIFYKQATPSEATQTVVKTVRRSLTTKRPQGDTNPPLTSTIPKARLERRQGDAACPAVIELNRAGSGGITKLGRNVDTATNDVDLQDPMVSRSHCTISWDEASHHFYVEDHSYTTEGNGTLRNGMQLDPLQGRQLLNHGDRLGIGPEIEYEFVLPQEPPTRRFGTPAAASQSKTKHFHTAPDKPTVAPVVPLEPVGPVEIVTPPPVTPSLPTPMPTPTVVDPPADKPNDADKGVSTKGGTTKINKTNS